MTRTASFNSITTIIQGIADPQIGGPDTLDETLQAFAMIRANYCMPGDQSYYFEVNIKEDACEKCIIPYRTALNVFTD